MANKNGPGKPFKMPMKPVKTKDRPGGKENTYKVPPNPLVKGPVRLPLGGK
jgi:hypothetical protein